MRAPRTVKLKTFAGVIGILIIALAFALQYALSASTVTIVPASFVETASYTIWKSGSTYYAKNGVGEVAYSGTNATTVLQAVFDVLADGIIFIKGKIIIEGSAAHYLTVGSSKNITLQGEGRQATVIAETATDTTTYLIVGDGTASLTIKDMTMDFTGAKKGDKIGGASAGFQSLIIKDVDALGNPTYAGEASGYAFVSQNITYARLENCRIQDFAYGYLPKLIGEAFILNNYVENCGTVGLVVDPIVPNTTLQMKNNILEDCGWTDEALGIDVGWGDDVVTVHGEISGNILVNPSKAFHTCAIVNIGGSGIKISDNTVFCDLQTANTWSAIYIGSTAAKPMSNVVIQENKITTSYQGIHTQNVFNCSISSNVVKLVTNTTLYGINYKTEATVHSGQSNIEDNEVIVESGGGTKQVGIYIRMFSAGASGSAKTYLQRNTIKADNGLEHDIAFANHPVILNDNFLDSSTPISKLGAVQVSYLKNSGSVEASNDDWVEHELAGTPDVVTLTVNETDANYCIQLKASNNTHFQIYLYDLTAGAAETVDKTILWYAKYEP